MTLKDWLKDTVKNKINDFRELFSELKLKDESESFIQSSEFVMCYPKEKLDFLFLDGIKAFLHFDFKLELRLNHTVEHSSHIHKRTANLLQSFIVDDSYLAALMSVDDIVVLTTRISRYDD